MLSLVDWRQTKSATTAVTPTCALCCGGTYLHDAASAYSAFMNCDVCRLTVHKHCYNMHEQTAGSPFVCDVCSLNVTASDIHCQLCNTTPAAPLRHLDGKWVHVSCALL